MTLEEVLKELKKNGTEQTRKTYRRHGVTNELFGVSYSELGALKKKIKTDHELAKKLWDTEIHDARILALMIVDPSKIDADLAERWVTGTGNYVVSSALAEPVSQSPIGLKLMAKWSKSKDEWIGRTGWLTLAHIAKQENDLSDSLFEDYLDVIEKGIHKARNRTRDGMNSALIGIAVRNEKLRPKALAAAGRIGKVEVDHGDTDCKTPDAATYIDKILKRSNAKDAKKAVSR